MPNEDKLLATQNKAHRRRTRRLRRRNRLRSQKPANVVAALAAIGLAGYCAYLGMNLLSKSPSNDVPEVLGISATSMPASTTSTLVLAERDYQLGECIIWDQRVGTDNERTTHAVPCAADHLFEFTGTVRVSDEQRTYPTDDEWGTITEAQCAPIVTQYLGYELDPHGRFAAGIIHPLEAGWSRGYRTISCGIQASGLLAPGDDAHLQPFAGAVKGQDQSDVDPVGTCLHDADDDSLKAVPCTEAHQVLVVGSVDADKIKAKPTVDASWSSAVANACTAVARDHLGKTVPPTLEVNYLPIAESSWKAGRRVAECVLQSTNEGNELPAELR